MMVRVQYVQLSKEGLLSTPENERMFFLSLTHLTNELVGLEEAKPRVMQLNLRGKLALE